MFQTGEEVTLHEVLDAREYRVRLQTELLERFPECTLINYKCNIPGPIKNNDAIKKLFQHGLDEVTRAVMMADLDVAHQKIINSRAGIEAFMLVNEEAKHVKELMIEVEQASAIGRLYDIDVIYRNDDEKVGLDQSTLQSLSRTELGFPERHCLICDQSAKACGRNRTHSVEEMQERITQMAKDDHII
ncbi:citrate lyase holo-[acyl-carrier protein] synthase [Streptococcus merionis]|uniref:citrate lyase holo-[acyl-carrier protein] synthase n=1 Tax=Streptococcus merionis TaxID=400065 RepID=UPI003511F787